MLHDVAGTKSQHDTTGLPTWWYCPVTMCDEAPEMSNIKIRGFSEENSGVLVVNQLYKYHMIAIPLFFRSSKRTLATLLLQHAATNQDLFQVFLLQPWSSFGKRSSSVNGFFSNVQDHTGNIDRVKREATQHSSLGNRGGSSQSFLDGQSDKGMRGIFYIYTLNM